MNWETYEPMVLDNIVEIEDEMNVIQGDMFGGHPYDSEEDDRYLITHISDEDVFAFNYDTGQFEHLPRSIVRDWMKTGRVFFPMLSSHSFTIENDAGEPVGIRAVGTAVQSEKLIREHGSDVFGFGIGLVFEEGLPATEIQEPYENDVYVSHPSLGCFIDDAMSDFSEAISERTSLGSEFSEELMRGVLGTLEQNARTRLKIDADPVLVDRDEQVMHISDPKENERNFVFSEDPDENQIVEFHGT